MYLRTTRRRNADASTVTYFQLAHNERDPETGAVRARVVHNFGRGDGQCRETLVRLARSIARVCGLQVHDPATDSADLPETSLLPADVHMLRTRELGLVHVVGALWEHLGIGPTLRGIQKRQNLSVDYERALFAMVANRLSDPQSKRGLFTRWLETVHLPSCASLKLPQLYEAMDLLLSHAEEIERTVFFRVADLFNMEVDVIFYDTTTVSFSIDVPDEDEDWRRLGYSKEGTWTPQVVVGLAVTRAGVPVRSWVFPGDMSDVATIEQVRADLRGWKLGRALFVADAGMNSNTNRAELARACGKYLLACRCGSSKEIQEQVLPRPGRYRRLSHNLRVKEVWIGDGVLAKRYLVCCNPEQARREAQHRKQVLAELKEKLASHSTRSASAQWASHLRASGRYGRYLTTEAGEIKISQEAITKAKRLDGKWVIETNDDTLTAEEAAVGYKSLLVIERCFRTLKKSHLHIAPVHHRLQDRIVAHVKICCLALLIERLMELKSGMTWTDISTALETVQATEFKTDCCAFFQCNELTKQVIDLMKTLEISTPKLVLDVIQGPRNT